MVAFKNGFVCSFGSGRVVILQLEKALKEIGQDDEFKFRSELANVWNNLAHISLSRIPFGVLFDFPGGL